MKKFTAEESVELLDEALNPIIYMWEDGAEDWPAVPEDEDV